jgi:hypothetical protein
VIRWSQTGPGDWTVLCARTWTVLCARSLRLRSQTGPGDWDWAVLYARSRALHLRETERKGGREGGREGDGKRWREGTLVREHVVSEYILGVWRMSRV